MIDELALSALFELGKLAVAGVSSLVSSGKPTAAETQGPTKLSPDQTEALGKLKELQEQERAEVRKQLLKKLADEKVLDARSIETLDEAREAAEIQDQQAEKVEQELLENSVLLPQQLLPPRIKSRKSIIPEAPYFDSLREFERQMKPFETKTNELESRIKTRNITIEALCGEIGKNLRESEEKLRAVKPEPENLFMDFFYFLSEIPKPPSLYELNQEFLRTTSVKDAAEAFEEVSKSNPENRKDKLDRLGEILGAQIQQVLGPLFPSRQVASLSAAVNNLFKQDPFSRKPAACVKPTQGPVTENGPSLVKSGPGKK